MIDVTPVNDLYEHENGSMCKCRPSMLEENGEIVIVHNSYDGRELKEAGKSEDEIKAHRVFSHLTMCGYEPLTKNLIRVGLFQVKNIGEGKLRFNVYDQKNDLDMEFTVNAADVTYKK